MKRIWTIIQRDLISTTRDSMLFYILVSPLILALGARLLLPTVGQSVTSLVMTEPTADTLGESLDNYVEVVTVRDEAALERRVLAFDEVVGVVPDGSGSYELLYEGNETNITQEMASTALQEALSGRPLPDVPVVEVGTERVPYRLWIGAFMAMGVIFFASLIMGFHIVVDKESGMIQAMGVSPLNRREYLLARGLLVTGIALISVFVALLGLGITTFNIVEILAMTLTGCLMGILFGFLMGATSANQIAAFAFMKIGFMPLMLPAVASLFLPDRWQWTMYWAPPYWIFVGFRRILVEGLGWEALWGPLALTAALTLVIAAGTYPFLKKRLTFAQG